MIFQKMPKKSPNLGLEFKLGKKTEKIAKNQENQAEIRPQNDDPPDPPGRWEKEVPGLEDMNLNGKVVKRFRLKTHPPGCWEKEVPGPEEMEFKGNVVKSLRLENPPSPPRPLGKRGPRPGRLLFGFGSEKE